MGVGVRSSEKPKVTLPPHLADLFSRKQVDRGKHSYNLSSVELGLFIEFYNAKDGRIFLDRLKLWQINTFLLAIYRLMKQPIDKESYKMLRSWRERACESYAGRLRGKTTEEMRDILGVKNDFTPEEEAKLRNEMAWVDGYEPGSLSPRRRDGEHHSQGRSRSSPSSRSGSSGSSHREPSGSPRYLPASPSLNDPSSTRSYSSGRSSDSRSSRSSGSSRSSHREPSGSPRHLPATPSLRGPSSAKSHSSEHSHRGGYHITSRDPQGPNHPSTPNRSRREPPRAVRI